METINYNFEKYKNYDFKTNWRDKIIPHLNNDEIIKSIERGIIGYKDNKMQFGDEYLYELTSFDEYFMGAEKNKYVAEYSSGDSFIMYKDELEEQIIDEENLDIDELFLISSIWIDFTFEETYHNPSIFGRHIIVNLDRLHF